MSVRQITGGYNEDASALGDSSKNVKRTNKSWKQDAVDDDIDEFPEFKIASGKAQASLRSQGPTPLLDDVYAESFAFQESAPTRHNIYRTYKDANGELREKWDIAEETMEQTFRDCVGRPVEERREKEIKTTGFPEAFRPRPMPHPDPAWERPTEPIPKRHDEMHLPNRTVYPDQQNWERSSTKVQKESFPIGGKTPK